MIDNGAITGFESAGHTSLTLHHDFCLGSGIENSVQKRLWEVFLKAKASFNEIMAATAEIDKLMQELSDED